MIPCFGERLRAQYKILWKEGDLLPSPRTDLALEAHQLRQKNAADCGAQLRRRIRCGYAVTEVAVQDAATARALGKPQGVYATLDLRTGQGEEAFPRAAQALADELSALLAAAPGEHTLVAGLGNRAMTPDAVGPLAAEHIFVTRYLRKSKDFASLAPVSVLSPGVLGRTGIETGEILHGVVRSVHPDRLIVIDALATLSLARVCTTVQLSNTGIVPGSGVGNHRCAIDRATMGIPVFSVGVPTVVNAVPGGKGALVTPYEIDAKIRSLSRVIGYGINLALQPLSLEELLHLTE